MSNVYRRVQSVVARVRGAGAAPGPHPRPALLLNCHFDSVPDSPGAADDAAGCAVLLETLRALAARRAPLARDAVFLFNGAEENIMQASHSFVTTHRWARAVRAFVNLEACGAGGREVLFQAGPRLPWLLEAYASAVPYPFASSLAQELFESGAIPGDTDFRIFRDFGNLSGVDLAWASNGYVYHTRLDTAERVPAAALQRTGDNVLALAEALLRADELGAAPADAPPAPVYFDVLGVAVVLLGARGAALLALATLALVALKLRASAADASRRLGVRRRAWARRVGVALCGGAAAHLLGAGASLLLGALLHACGARLVFFARPWLLLPLYAMPALAVTWAAALRMAGGGGPGGGAGRHWWRARAWHDALALGGALALAAGAAAGLRSAFVPLLWALPAAAADLLAGAAGARPGARALAWAAAALPPLLQTSYLALAAARTVVPVLGRAGAGGGGPDVAAAALSALLALGCCAWLLPPLAATRCASRLPRLAAAASLLAAAYALLSGPSAPYSSECPQRVMVFHVRRTVHWAGASPASPSSFYWVPELDANVLRTVRPHVAGLRAVQAAECERWPFCGAPYYLPALSLLPSSYVAPAPHAPAPALNASLRLAPLAPQGGEAGRELLLELAGPSHAVLVVAPREGARLVGVRVGGAEGPPPLEGPRWGARRTYFVALHDAGAARGPDSRAAWSLRLELRGPAAGADSGPWADVSLAGHALFGPHAKRGAHARLLAGFPAWVAATGWGVDLHLYRL